MFRRFEWLIVSLGSLAWFAIQTPWELFTDPDAFYHAHVARLLSDGGPLRAFPWLDLTTFGQHFVDHHFLFHLVSVPAVWIADRVAPGPFAAFWAGQFMAPLFAVATTLTLWSVLKRLDRERAWIWTALTLLVPVFTLRMTLAKASPVAVGLFIAVIGVLTLSDRKKKTGPLLLSLVGFLFALSHGGWIIALLGAGSIVCGDLLFRKVGEDRSWRETIVLMPWKECAGLFSGIVLGLLLHPNRENLLSFLWVQVFKAGIAPPAHIIQGGEWRSATAAFVIWELAPLLVAALVAVATLVLSKRVRLNAERFRHVVTLAFPVALTLALSLNGRRFLEYFVPAFTLWLAGIWSLVELGAVRDAADRLRSSWPRLLQRAAAPIAMGLAIALAGHHAWSAWVSLRAPQAKPFNAYRSAMNAISEHAVPGDRVFHSDWDEFPLLFAADDRLRYVTGLDPVFLADANPELSTAIVDLTQGISTSSIREIIAQQTGSSFVFVTTKRHPLFDQALQKSPYFIEIFRDSDTVAYQVKNEAQ